MSENLDLYVPNELGRGLQRFEFRFEGAQFAGPEFRIRYGRDSQDTPVAQKIAHGGPDAYRQLQREVRIGRILVQRIGKNEYPIYLSRLIGYNPGREENLSQDAPYSVFTYQRATLADLADELPLQPELLRPVTDGLIIALCYLQAAGVVHRHLRLDTVHWDGTTVQLADFEHAAAEWDDNPGAVGEVPWDAPEQRAGPAAADTRDDSYAAALLMARLITGQEFTDDEEAREAIARMDLTQQHLLRDAAADYRRDRPTAYELRKRRRLPDPLNPVLRANRGHESEARARFATLRQRQRSALRRLQEAREAQERAAAHGSTRSRASEWWQVPHISSNQGSPARTSSAQAGSGRSGSRWYNQTGKPPGQAPPPQAHPPPPAQSQPTVPTVPTAPAWPTPGSPGPAMSSMRASAMPGSHAQLQRVSRTPVPPGVLVTGAIIVLAIVLVFLLS